MNNEFNLTTVMKKIADDIQYYINITKDKLSYDRTYSGVIIKKQEETYTVQIKNDEYIIKSKLPLTVGMNVKIMAIQNNMNNLILLIDGNLLSKLL